MAANLKPYVIIKYNLTSIGIPSSPVIISTTIIPGLIILRFRTLFPGDANISFIVNITDSESLITSVSDQFTNYQSNSIVSINISIPNGGLISIRALALNQYGVSNETMIEGFLNVPPSEMIKILCSSLHRQIVFML